MSLLGSDIRVYLAVGTTDMRKSIDGLSLLVAGHLDLDPFSGHLFAFCNRARTIVKILYWDRNGFCIWHKRLERHRFQWPRCEEEVLAMERRELTWLLDGLDPMAVRGHPSLKYTEVL
ncbi:MAG: IS66 family insertion sequence element accessory protein TnpB [Proteobacteria bacterium]|nr:IS66 family insertion sequence element accessory protein TnpB [Pseudomonadota bacterium]MBU1612026.1 IS66 family insertion sequence element accessory protein TnpB [Pseudomonadota bacterium]